MSCTPEYIFALKLTDKVLKPCFYTGNEIIFEYELVNDFNAWFFSKIGYFLFIKQGDLLTIGLDHNLFKLFKGNKQWLNVACQREYLLKIYIKKLFKVSVIK